jgi:hypothetical protein
MGGIILLTALTMELHNYSAVIVQTIEFDFNCRSLLVTAARGYDLLFTSEIPCATALVYLKYS